MVNNKWINLCTDYKKSSNLVSTLKCDKIEGFILKFMNLAKAEDFECEMHSIAWGVGVCCLIEKKFSLDASNSIVESMRISGYMPSLDVSRHVAIFPNVEKSNLFSVMNFLNKGFNDKELILIRDLLEEMNWFSLRYVGDRVMRIGIDFKSIHKTSLDNLISEYQNVMREIYSDTSMPSKRQIISILKSSESLYFADFGC